MQTLTEIRQMLDQAGLRPQKAFGQCFLIDHNMLAKLLELAELAEAADVPAGLGVLEVGPGTGTLTEELLDRGIGVTAAEIDHGLCRLLRQRLAARPGFTLVEGDVLAGKHAIAPGVLEALPELTQLVSNLPYNIATPLLAECLIESWRHQKRPAPSRRLFTRMSFTVQREVADRLSAGPGSDAYGPVSVLAAALARSRRARSSRRAHSGHGPTSRAACAGSTSTRPGRRRWPTRNCWPSFSSRRSGSGENR